MKEISVIRETSGNILTVRAEALVCPVNCVGVMGAGLALQFRHAFPRAHVSYKGDCAAGRLRLGRVTISILETRLPRMIVFFSTKRHWRDKSALTDIEEGLVGLTEVVELHGVRSIAIPALGCGLGGLRWGDVRPLIERAFAPLPDVEVLLFPPQNKGAGG